MWFALRYLYLPAVVLCLEQSRGEDVGEIRERFHFRRAVDGTRGRKYFDPVTDGSYDSYGSAGGNYEPNQLESGFSDIRRNVPGEPGVSYPTYTTVPRTSFSCAGRNQGYYADEETGCQAFYVCNSGTVASFICPVGSIFSQTLLTCEWWNKVNCGVTDNHASSYQQNYDNHSEMVQKAYTMMQLPERNRVENYQQTGARRRVKVKRIKVEPNSVSEFAAAGDRGTENYNNFGSSEPRVVENYPFGRNSYDSNRQSQKGIINVRLQPEEFVVNEQEQGPIVNTPAKDSSIIYIQKNEDVSPQNTYTQSGPSDFGNNFQNYYGQEMFDFGNQFKPSYAPTVPTVTTTTRRFYSPTVPTPYKLSTISYGNYDQDYQGSRHLYSSNNRGVDLLTTPQTIAYEDGELGDSQNPGDKESDQSDETANEEIQSPINPPENLQPEEPKAVNQNDDTNLQHEGKRHVENVETENRSGLQSEQEAAKESDSGSADSNNTSASSETGTVINENKEKSDTLNPDLDITPLFAQIPRPTRPPGQQVVDIADQLVSKPFNEAPQSIPRLSEPASPSNVDSVNVTEGKEDFNASSQIPPFTTSTLESTGSSAVNSTKILDQITQTFQPAKKIPNLVSQTAQSMSALPQTDQNVSGTSDESTSDVSVVPLISPTSQSVAPPELDSTDVVEGAEIFESSSSIPTIPQLSQPVVSSRTQSPGKNNDLASSSRMQSLKQTNNQSNLDISMIPPLGSLALQIVKLSRMDIVDPLLYTQTFDSVSRIPLLITQDMQPRASWRKRSRRRTINNNNNNDDISQALPRIPSFISQTPHSSALPKTQSSGASRDRNPFAILARIPWLNFRASQLVRSSETKSPSITNHGSNSRALRWIPAFFRQILKRSEPLTSQPSVSTRNRNVFDLPAKIPPLVPLPVQSASASRVNDPSDISVNIDIDKPLVPPQFLESFGIDGLSEMNSTDLQILLPMLETSRIPPLIPQAAQSASPSEIKDLIEINENSDIDEPSDPPFLQTFPLIDTQTLEPSNEIPPLIPFTVQSASSSRVNDSSDINVNININKPLVPPQFLETFETDEAPATDSTDLSIILPTLETSSKIPPLIPDGAQSASPSINHDLFEINGNNDFDVPSEPPPIFQTLPTDRPFVMDSIDASPDTQTLKPFTRIPPLIPQAAWPVSPSIINDLIEMNGNSNSDVPSESPPIFQTPITNRPSEADFTDPPIDTQTPESFTGIPQSMFTTSPSIITPGNESPSVTNDSSTMRSPPRITDLISQFLLPATAPDSQVPASSAGVQDPSEVNLNSDIDVPSESPPISQTFPTDRPSEIDSTNAPLDPQTPGPPTRIPPLIPQFTRPISSSGVNDPREIASTDIGVPLDPPISQTIPTEQPSVMDSDDAPIDTQTRRPSTRIPPLILQTARPDSSPGVNDPSDFANSNIDEPSESPPIFQTPITNRPSEADFTDLPIDTQTPESFTGIPQSMFPNSPSIMTPGNESPSVINDSSTMRSPPRITDLISQLLPPTTAPDSQVPASSAGVQDPSEVDLNSNIDVPSESPPISQTFPTDRPSEIDSTNASLDPQTPGPPTRIPPLIFPSLSPITPMGMGSPSVTNDDSITRRPPQISSLIPQSPSETNDNSNSDVSAPSPLNPVIPEMIGPAGTDSMDASPFVPQTSQTIEPMQTDSTDFAVKIPLSIPQDPEPVAPSNTQPMDAVENENDAPPKTPSLIPQNPESSISSGSPFGTNLDRELFDISTQPPSTINQASIPLSLLGTQFTDIFNRKETSLQPTFDFNYEIQSFNPSVSSIPATVVRFRGRYQNPSPFIQFQAPTGLPGQQFVIGSTSDRAVYDFYRGRGLRPGIESETLRLPMRSEDSTTEDFRINIPDLPFLADESPKGTVVRSPPRQNDSPNTESPKTSSELPTIVNIGNATPIPKLNHTNRFPYEFPIASHSQSKSFDRPSSAFDLYSKQSSDSFSTLNTKNVGTTTPSQPKVPTSTPFALNSDISRYSSLQQTVPTQPKIPISTQFPLNSDGSRFNSFKQTVSTESKASKSTPFTPNFDSSRFSSFERTVPRQPKIPTSTPLNHNPGYSRLDPLKQTVSTERKAPTSTPFTPNFDSSRFGSLEKTVSSQPKIPTSTPLNHNPDYSRFDSLKQTVSIERKAPTSTPFTPNFDSSRFGSLEKIVSSQPKIPTSTPLNHNPEYSRFDPLKQTVSTERKAPTSTPFTPNFDSSRFGSFKQTVPTEPKTRTSTPFTLNVDANRYSSFGQTGSPIVQKTAPIKSPENNEDLQFTIRGALDKYLASSTSSQQSSPPGRFGHSRELFGSSTPSNIIRTGGSNKFAEDLRETKKEPPKISQTSTLPHELPESLSEFETVASLNNEEPYEIRFTVNADEDFKPSEEFISKILAEHVNSESSGFDGLQGYEIIRSDNPDGSDQKQDVKPTSAPNIQRTVGLVPSPSIAGTNLRGSQRTEQPRLSFHNSNRGILSPQATQDPVRKLGPGYPLYNSNRDIPKPQVYRNPVAKVESPNSDVFPRPFFLGKQPDVASQPKIDPRFNNFPVNPSIFGSNTGFKDLRNGLDYSKTRINPADINGSLKSLFDSPPAVAESPPQHTELILDELKKLFGEPLYRSNSKISFTSPKDAPITDRRSKQQFADLQQYRVRTDPASGQQQPLTSPKPPTTSTTTTTAAPEPVKTFVETEFIPSLSFSFDYDEGRQQYVEAVLQGLLTEDQNPELLSGDANSNEESNQN